MGDFFLSFCYFTFFWNKVLKKKKKKYLRPRYLGNQMNIPWVEQIRTEYYFVVVKKNPHISFTVLFKVIVDIYSKFLFLLTKWNERWGIDISMNNMGIDP